MNYATKRLHAAASASLNAWEDMDERHVRDRHREMIDELESALFYFDAHGESQKQDRD